MTSFSREVQNFTVDVGTDAASSDKIELARFACASFQFPADTETTEVTLYAALADGDYGVAYDEDGQPWARAVQAGAPMAFPTFAYAFPSVKLVASGGTASSSVPVFAKS